MVIEHYWLTKKANNMSIKTDWLNNLVDRGGNEITSFHLNKYDFAAAYLGTRYYCFYAVANMNNSSGQKRILSSAGLRATCFSRGQKGHAFEA